jgi:hypothetical protein
VRAARDAVRTEQDVLHIRRIHDHGHDDVRPLRHLTWRADDGRAIASQRLGARRRPVRDRDLVAGLQRVPGHGGAHDAGADEADPFSHG